MPVVRYNFRNLSLTNLEDRSRFNSYEYLAEPGIQKVFSIHVNLITGTLIIVHKLFK